MRSLVVEDDFANRIVLQHLLLPFGECDIAKDGTEALAAFERAQEEGNPYDLICLDLRMPHLSGLEVLRELRAREQKRQIRHPQSVRVIVVTAVDESREVIETYSAGCEAYLVKPIAKQLFLKELHKLGLISDAPRGNIEDPG